MRILGIDPGYGITGFGVIEANRGASRLLSCGAITTPAGMDFSARLEIIYEDMRKLLEQAKPDDAADAIAIALCHARSSTSLLAQLQTK